MARFIPGFENLYTVTEDGVIQGWQPMHRHPVPGYVVKPYIDKAGYETVALWKNKKRTRMQVRRAVALAYISLPPADQPEVMTLDGNKKNTHYTNLKWVSHIDNHRIAVSRGNPARGERHPAAVLSENQVKEIRKRADSGEPQKDLAIAFKCSTSLISQIVNRRRWSHI